MPSLARLLAKYRPTEASPDVQETGALLVDTIGEVSAAFVQRHRESGSSFAAQEVELDAIMDTLWYTLRDRVLHWEVFERPGLRQAAAEQQEDGFDYQACVAKAESAARIRKLLLVQGFEFLRQPYAEQAEHMRTLWTIIQEEKLEAPLSELIGPEFLGPSPTFGPAMTRCSPSGWNLREASLDLQRAIQNYVIALLSMVDNRTGSLRFDSPFR